MSTAQIDLLLSRLDGVKQTGHNRWIAKCSVHPDKTASVGIKETDQGTIIMHCFAGCDTGTVLAAIGLTFSDLFPAKTAKDYDPTKPRPKAPKFSKSELFDPLLIEAVILALTYDAQTSGEPISDTDHKRTIMAFNSIMRLHTEVYA